MSEFPHRMKTMGMRNPCNVPTKQSLPTLPGCPLFAQVFLSPGMAQKAELSPLTHSSCLWGYLVYEEPASDMAPLDIGIFIFTELYNKGWDKTLSKQMGKVHAYSCSSQATSYWHTCSFGKWFCSQRLRLCKAAVAGLDNELGVLKSASMRIISPQTLRVTYPRQNNVLTTNCSHCSTSNHSTCLLPADPFLLWLVLN